MQMNVLGHEFQVVIHFVTKRMIGKSKKCKLVDSSITDNEFFIIFQINDCVLML